MYTLEVQRAYCSLKLIKFIYIFVWNTCFTNQDVHGIVHKYTLIDLISELLCEVWSWNLI